MSDFDTFTRGITTAERIEVAESAAVFRQTIRGKMASAILRKCYKKGELSGRSAVRDVCLAELELIDKHIPGSLDSSSILGQLPIAPEDLRELRIKHEENEPLTVQGEFKQIHFSDLQTRRPFMLTSISFESNSQLRDGEELVTINNDILSLIETNHNNY